MNSVQSAGREGRNGREGGADGAEAARREPASRDAGLEREGECAEKVAGAGFGGVFKEEELEPAKVDDGEETDARGVKASKPVLGDEDGDNADTDADFCGRGGGCLRPELRAETGRAGSADEAAAAAEDTDEDEDGRSDKGGTSFNLAAPAPAALATVKAVGCVREENPLRAERGSANLEDSAFTLDMEMEGRTGGDGTLM